MPCHRSVDGWNRILSDAEILSVSKKTPDGCQNGWKLCLNGSRLAHPANSRYASIEGETLAVVHALHKNTLFCSWM